MHVQIVLPTYRIIEPFHLSVKDVIAMNIITIILSYYARFAMIRVKHARNSESINATAAIH